jgi:heterotetrameric sarcosine oxidase delta subunit
MIVIPCPHCGPRNHDEFVYAGDAGPGLPAADAPLAAWTASVYSRENPRGAHRELWRHSYGCGAYLVVERDTRTHEVASAAFAGEETDHDR